MGSIYSKACCTQGWFKSQVGHSETAWHFIMLLRTEWNLKIMNYLFLRYQFNIFRPWLTTDSWYCGKQNHGSGRTTIDYSCSWLSLPCFQFLFKWYLLNEAFLNTLFKYILLFLSHLPCFTFTTSHSIYLL